MIERHFSSTAMAAISDDLSDNDFDVPRDVYRTKIFLRFYAKGGAFYVRALCIVTDAGRGCFLLHPREGGCCPSLATLISSTYQSWQHISVIWNIYIP